MSQKNIREDRETGGSEGVENVSSAIVRERAIQLAIIDGRREDEVNQHDIDRAEQELRDDERLDVVRNDLPRELSNSPLAGDPTPSPGKQAENTSFDDNANTSSELIQQGMDEALHDEMLEAGKQTRNSARASKDDSGQSPER